MPADRLPSTLPVNPVLAYLFSRFPVVSQTFCDTEMLALEASGIPLVIGSLNPPLNSFRHERLASLKAEILYPPPAALLDWPLQHPPSDPVWQAMAELAEEHETKYGPSVKARIRARNAWYFAREFKKRGVTHIHIHFANRATHTALFLRKAGFTFSFTAHAQDFMVDLKNDDLLREMIMEATFTAAVSDFSRNLLINICPAAASRIHRVYNGINSSQFPSAQNHGGVSAPPSASSDSPNPFRIISIGRLIDFKGFPILLEAVALLRKNGIPARLQIIGDGPQRPALEAQIKHLQLEDSVRLRGVLSQEEIKRELASSHAFALACLTDEKGATDILPTVILEAMACGLPVVSTTLAGVPEMVIHGETGLLAPPQDASTLAAHLTALARDPALQTQYGSAGLDRVRTVFSLTNTAGHLASLFPPEIRETPPPAPPPKLHVLAVLDCPAGPDPLLLKELHFLTNHNAVSVMATRQTPLSLPSSGDSEPAAPSPADNIIFLPDATVLEASWRSHPAMVAKIEALRHEAGSVDGEEFYRAARRAVHLASQQPIHHWTRLHALRAASVLPVWLLHHLTNLPAAATIEATHAESRSVLSKLLADFDDGSNSDPKLKTHLPDLLKLQPPPPKKRLLRLRPPQPAPSPDPATVWQEWLTHSPSPLPPPAS